MIVNEYKISLIDEYNKMKNMNKINDTLYEKNNSFLESLEENQMELLFEKILKINDNILIIHNDNYHNNKLCNKYYNNFFKKYKSITIDKKEFIKIEGNFKDELKTHIHLNKSIIDNENSLYKNIYHYLNNAMGAYYNLNLEDIYQNSKE